MPANRRRRRMRLNILGKDWKIAFVTRRWYKKRIDKNHEDCEAITLCKDRVICFIIDDTDIITIRHELVHAYVEMCCAGHSELNKDGFEEIMADMIAVHGFNLLKQAVEVAEYFGVSAEERK